MIELLRNHSEAFGATMEGIVTVKVAKAMTDIVISAVTVAAIAITNAVIDCRHDRHEML